MVAENPLAEEEEVQVGPQVELLVLVGRLLTDHLNPRIEGGLGDLLPKRIGEGSGDVLLVLAILVAGLEPGQEKGRRSRHNTKML